MRDINAIYVLDFISAAAFGYIIAQLQELLEGVPGAIRHELRERRQERA